MESLDRTANQALRALLDSQPNTTAKVAFAWRMAAGAALARAGEPEWQNGVLVVRARSDAWRRELRRARPVLTGRVQELVGADVVKSIVIE
jgi:predicted nucleic acid-binding Zn ribbon protein